MFLITPAEKATIYKRNYWDKVRGDDLPVGLDFVVYDASVNSGCGQAGKWLQQALGAAYTGAQDGMLGDKTIQAIEDHGDVDSLIEEFCSRRLATLKRLRTYKTYGKGWSARIANGQKIAISWQDANAAVVHPVDVTNDNGHRKAFIDDSTLVTPPISQIATHVTTAAGSIGTVASQTATQVQSLSDTFSWMKYVFGGLTLAAVVAGIAVKFSSDATEAAAKGSAHAHVDPDADANSTPVAVNDNAPLPVLATGTGG